MGYIGQTPTKVPLTSADITDGTIALADMAANSVDSDQYVDGSIDAAHLSANSIDSDAYVDGSIDLAHIATNQIDETLLKDALVGDFTDATVTASDYFLHGDATDSGDTKKDTVQGILDLVPSAGFTLGTSQATTSGTSITHTGIAAGANVVFITFNKVSTNGTDVMLIRIGDSGGIEASAYVTASFEVDGSEAGSTAGTGFLLHTSSASNSISGQMILTRETGNVWTASFTGYYLSTPSLIISGGIKTLSGELTQLTVVMSGSNAFDAGAINISYI